MMNYETMSDFEVNRAVACRLDGNDLDIFGRPMFASDCYFSVPSGSSVDWHQFGCDGSKLFDPCNNPSDAWPIILEYQISIAKYEWLEKWDAHGGGVCVDYDHCIISNSDCSYSNKNPLRAAMVVFLMMQESKS